MNTLSLAKMVNTSQMIYLPQVFNQVSAKVNNNVSQGKCVVTFHEPIGVYVDGTSLVGVKSVDITDKEIVFHNEIKNDKFVVPVCETIHIIHIPKNN